MKTFYKYLILIFITVFASILIFNYVEDNTPVSVEEDTLTYQNNKETEILGNTNYTIDNPNIVINPYDISPLSALVIFQTKDIASAKVTIKGKDDDDDITNTFLPSKVHILPIYGLYPDYENTIIINSSGEEKEINIKTNPLPDEIKNGDVKEVNDTTDFYFTTSINGKPIAYDKNGNVRWYLTKDYSWEFTRLSNGHILLGNNHLTSSSYDSLGLVEMDMLGKTYFEYNLPGSYHNDVYELNNGNLLVLSNDKQDYIAEVDRNTGVIVKEFKIASLLKTKNLKLNSLVYDASNNSITTLSGNKNMIINIDYASGEINWIIGKTNKNLEKYALTSKDKLPENPNGLAITEEGNIAFISVDNEDNNLTLYSTDLVNRTFKEITNINLDKKYENVNLNYNDKTFIISQNTKVKQVKDDEVSDILTTNHNIYSTNKMPIYAGDVYITGKGQRLGNIGVTETTNNNWLIFWKTDDSIYKKYNLSLYKDANRLTVKGNFKKNDKVQIILDNILNKSTYDVNPKDNVTYINEEGLNGKFYIYLKINGTVYKLHKYTNFY